MHEPWDAALTSNLSVGGLCQLIYLMTITVQPWTRISDLRVEFKYSKLLKRLVNAFNAVKMEQSHWNRVCAMIGSGISHSHRRFFESLCSPIGLAAHLDD